MFYTHGLIRADQNHNIIFWVPLYKQRLYKAFYPYTNGEPTHIQNNLWIEEFILKNGELNLPKLIESYMAYVQRRSFRYFREKDKEGNYLSIKEAALLYSFETYIQAFLQVAEGKSYWEAHTGLGRSDLIINLHGREYYVEAKVYHNSTWFQKGKPQLAYYCQKAGLQEGYYLVFVSNALRLPPYVKKQTEVFEGVTIHTYIVMFDEEKDF